MMNCLACRQLESIDKALQSTSVQQLIRHWPVYTASRYMRFFHVTQNIPSTLCRPTLKDSDTAIVSKDFY